MEPEQRAARAAAYESVRPEIVDLVPAAARRVLDLGCSTGWLAAALKARGPVEVVGVEREPAYAAGGARALRPGGRGGRRGARAAGRRGAGPLRLPRGGRRARAPGRPVERAGGLRRAAGARLPRDRLAPQRRALDDVRGARARELAAPGGGHPRRDAPALVHAARRGRAARGRGAARRGRRAAAVGAVARDPARPPRGRADARPGGARGASPSSTCWRRDVRNLSRP